MCCSHPFAKGRQLTTVSDSNTSTMLAIMGRMAAYTGQSITWQQALESRESLAPAEYTWEARPPVSVVAMPGVTRFA